MYTNDPSLKTALERKEVIRHRNDCSKILLNQLRMVLYRLRERAENNASIGELIFERRRNGYTVEDSVDGNTRRAFMQDASLS